MRNTEISFCTEINCKTALPNYMRVSPLWIFPHSPWYRLSVAAVRDCGLLSCQNTPKFERGRMLDLPLKPLLLLHFVTNWPSFLSSDTPFCLSTISIISFCLSDSVSAKFYFLSGIFLVFFGWAKQALLQTLVCGLALSGLQMCLLCVRVHIS